ncbi:MAG: hypothetical protein M0R06_02015 [Sphaerochaeta sp.]|jgi:hypothetical protein|nr:hypothetical protein [Sphaerochaeta sp.]
MKDYAKQDFLKSPNMKGQCDSCGRESDMDKCWCCLPFHEAEYDRYKEEHNLAV